MIQTKNKLSDYLNLWSLSDARPLAATGTSFLYRVTSAIHGPAVLKIFTELGAQDEAGAAEFLRAAAGRGAVALHAHDDGALLMEFLEGPDLRSLPDQASASIIADLVAGFGECGFGEARTLESWFSALFAASGDVIFKRGAQVARELLMSQGDVRLLHGDLHHGNILWSASQSRCLAIDPKGLLGEGTFDLAHSFYNPEQAHCDDPERIQMLASLYSAKLNLDRARILKFAFAYGCLSATWFITDGLPERVAPTLAIAQAIEAKITR